MACIQVWFELEELLQCCNSTSARRGDVSQAWRNPSLRSLPRGVQLKFLMSLKDRFLSHRKIGSGRRQEEQRPVFGAAGVISPIKIIDWTPSGTSLRIGFTGSIGLLATSCRQNRPSAVSPGLPPRHCRAGDDKVSPEGSGYRIVLFGAIFKFTTQKGRPARVRRWVRIQHRQRE